MIVTCPACESRFQVDEAQLGPDGRIVRCGKCGNCWHQMPGDDPRAGLADVPPPPPRRRAAPPPKKKGKGVLVGWLLLLAFVGGAAAVGWFERARIVAQFPQLADVYHLLGVPLPEAGASLQLSNVTTSRAEVDGDDVVTVRGQLANISQRKQMLPPLRIQLSDSAGAVVTEWFFDLPERELDAGESVGFETVTKNPPSSASSVSVTFAGQAQPVEESAAQ